MIRTAAILAAGLGTRMQRADDAVPLEASREAAAQQGLKGMIPIKRPFLDYVLSALAEAGIVEVVLVLGPNHDAVRRYFTHESPPQRVRIRFAEQATPQGTADAVCCAASVIGEEPFLVLNADNYYPVEALRALAAEQSAGTVAFDREALVALGNITTERVRAFAILTVSDDERLVGIREKPGADVDLTSEEARWVGMNCWAVTPALVAACAAVPRSARGELELPEAVGLAIQHGVPIRAIRMAAPVLDLSQRSDIASVVVHLAAVEPMP